MDEAKKPAAALAAMAAAQAPYLRVRRTIPGGVGTITEGAAEKRNADALRRADGLKEKISALQLDIDRFKNSRDRAIKALRGEKDQLTGDLADLTQKIRIGKTRQEDLDQQIEAAEQTIVRLQQEKVQVEEFDNLLKDRIGVTQDRSAANTLHLGWAAAQDQPKIDQLTGKRDKLIMRLYHLQNLHPGIFPEKESNEDA